MKGRTDFMDLDTLISRAAFLGWEDMRDGVVNPLVEPTRRNIGALCARGIAKLSVQNASSFIDDIFHKITDHVDLFAKQIKGAVEPLCGPEERLRSIDRAVVDRGEGLATTIAALERLRSRALAEPERIDRALREATARFVFEHGSLEGLWACDAETASAEEIANLMRAARAGYFLMIATRTRRSTEQRGTGHE